MPREETYALSTGGDLFGSGDGEVRGLFEAIRRTFPEAGRIRLEIDLRGEQKLFLFESPAPGEPPRLDLLAEPSSEPVADGTAILDFDEPPLLAGRMTLEPPGADDGRLLSAVAAARPLLERAIRSTLGLCRLAAENRLLLAVCDRSDTSILLFDERHQIIWANNRADAILSRQTEELLAVSLTEDRAIQLFQFLLEALPRAGGRPPRGAPHDAEGDRIRRQILLTNGTRFDLTVTRLSSRDGSSTGALDLVMLRETRRFEMEKARSGLRQSGLSEREVEVVGLLLLGLKNAEIAERLGISGYTVKDHLKHIFHKLNLRSRSELVSHVLQLSG